MMMMMIIIIISISIIIIIVIIESYWKNCRGKTNICIQS